MPLVVAAVLLEDEPDPARRARAASEIVAVSPLSAVVLQPSGERAVTLLDGTRRPVEVVVQADGFAVVDGLEPGSEIQLPMPPGS